jgi:hypothetical protein
MTRRQQLARRARAILTAVDSDLREIWEPQQNRGDASSCPVVAVDWSEIFAFASKVLPSQANVPRYLVSPLRWPLLSFL